MIPTDVARPLVLVPETALERSATGEVAYLYQEQKPGEGKAVKRSVRTGGRANGMVAVLSGVADGETVITSGQVGLSDGIAVRKVAKSTPAPSPRSAP